MNFPTSPHTLKTLVCSCQPIIVIETVEEERVLHLLQAVTRQLQMPLFEWTITQGLVRISGTTVDGTTTFPPHLLKHLEKLPVEGVFLLKDFAEYLKDPAIARQFRDVSQRFSKSRSTLILTGESVSLPPEIAHQAVYCNLNPPSSRELHETLVSVIHSLRAKNQPIQVQLSPQNMQALLRALSGLTLNQARHILTYAALEDGKLSERDIQLVLEHKIEILQEGRLLEYFPVAENTCALGGFARLKTWLQRAQVGFSPEAQALNLHPPKGILLVGVQGCGKSLATKAIARNWQLPLLRLDAASLFDKYIGESEKNLRKAIALAESMAPIILWIDEIEKAWSLGGGDDLDSQLSRRLLGTFLTWLQEKRQEVFVVATANDVFRLPPELLRKGRFDEIFFVDLPNATERQEIFQTHLIGHKQTPETFDVKLLAAESEGFSGAEIEQVVIAALYQSLYLKRPLNTALLLEAIRTTIPLSVSRKEEIAALRAIAQGRFVNVR